MIINNVPDCLVKVPDSVGCHIKQNKAIEYLPLLKTANREFITYAILNTRQIPVMKDALSIGFIEYLEQLGFLNPTPENKYFDIQSEEQIAEELPIDELGMLSEGIKKTILVNTYERNPKARNECIKYWKPICIVCGFDFENEFGELGKGFIHVHHLTQISDIGEKYKVDPINDLRPVCPNCHSMLHRKNPPFRVDELKQIIEKQR